MNDLRVPKAVTVNEGELAPAGAAPAVQPSLARTQSTKRQRRLAISAAALLFILGAVATPFATAQLLAIPGYMTAFGSAMIVINILLAALLFSRGAIDANGDATRLGTAYLFVAVIFVPLVASFPGGIMPEPLIGTPITAIWLWSFWHGGFGLYIIRYAWAARRQSGVASLPAALISTVAVVAMLSVVATSLLRFLPSTLSDGHTMFSGVSGLIPIVILAILAVAFALVCRLRAGNLEQMSLIVAMAAAIFDVWLTYQGSSRFALGWYVSKCGSLLTSLVVLITLLHEVTLLHRRAAVDNRDLEQLARKLTVARDESERANGAKSRFLASISHELRTPLNGIIGYAQLLHLEAGLTPAQSDRVAAMQAAGTHLLEMINSVLDLSQIEAERLEIHAVPTDPRTMATACLDLVRPASQAKALTLQVTTAPDVPGHIMVDPVRLRQVLFNLLGNAVKFTAEGSIGLCLSLVNEGKTLRVEVADTGRGVPDELRHHLFRPFERLGAEAMGHIEGAGLGLALSARIAALMGGRLGYDNNLGGGSLFWLELPLQPCPVQSDPQTPASLPKPPPAAVPGPIAEPRAPSSDTPIDEPFTATAARPLRVLVVDDVAMNREIATVFLTMGGLHVATAEDGAEAVKAVANEDFDVVLMDVRMPVMDGLEATRRIRELPGQRACVPIIALTAQVFAEQIEECRRAGMDSNLSKPFTQQSLLAAVLLAVKSPTEMAA